jgi:Mg-chelatase subunit ChlD
MCEKTPPGILRRIWLLSDGYPNREEGRIAKVLANARQQRVNINTIGFGDTYDEHLLRQISSSTHNGKFVPVRTMQELTEALMKSGQNGHGRRKRRHQAETTIVAIDLSASMTDPMDGRTKIQVVQQVLLQLLLYKQRCYA